MTDHGRRTTPFLFCLVLTACSNASVPSPEQVPAGAKCARCGMPIARLEFAAQTVFPNASPRFYDDIGCLVMDSLARKPGGRFYAQLAGGRGWVRVEDVAYASPAGLQSPMGFNFVAYPEEEARAVDRGGRARSWDELVYDVERQGR